MKIVITGMGLVSSVGINVESAWSAICKGESGIRPLTRFDTKDFAFSKGGEIGSYELPPEIAGTARNSDVATKFMLTAAHEAITSSGLNKHGPPAGIGVALATNFGDVSSGETFLAYALGHEKNPGHGISALSFQTCADTVAKQWNFTGPRVVLSLSCSAGTAIIGYAAGLIRAGRAKAVLAGGYDALSRFAWSGLSVLRTMSKDAVKPFDKNRDGTIFSEGAGALIVEEYEHAKARGAVILAEIAGYGLNNNAFHMTAPAKEGAGSAAVMQSALADAGMTPDEIDHINAHGTGTKPNDVTETQAIKTVFGEHARKIPITSIKSSVGHMLGAAGSIEAIASILSIRDSVIPPTMNYRDPDPECDLDYVTNVKRETKIKTVLSNSAGIGGCNSAVIFRSLVGTSLAPPAAK